MISALGSGTGIAVAVVLLVTWFVVIRGIGGLWVRRLVVRWFRVGWLVGRVFAIAFVLRVSSGLGLRKRNGNNANSNLEKLVERWVNEF